MTRMFLSPFTLWLLCAYCTKENTFTVSWVWNEISFSCWSVVFNLIYWIPSRNFEILAILRNVMGPARLLKDWKSRWKWTPIYIILVPVPVLGMNPSPPIIKVLDLMKLLFHRTTFLTHNLHSIKVTLSTCTIQWLQWVHKMCAIFTTI